MIEVEVKARAPEDMAERIAAYRQTDQNPGKQIPTPQMNMKG